MAILDSIVGQIKELSAVLSQKFESCLCRCPLIWLVLLNFIMTMSECTKVENAITGFPESRGCKVIETAFIVLYTPISIPY